MQIFIYIDINIPFTKQLIKNIFIDFLYYVFSGETLTYEFNHNHVKFENFIDTKINMPKLIQISF